MKTKRLYFYLGRESEETFKPGERVKTMTGDAGKSYWKMTDYLVYTIYISEVISNRTKCSRGRINIVCHSLMTQTQTDVLFLINTYPLKLLAYTPSWDCFQRKTGV